MLSPRAVALQGIGFAPPVVAVQGFAPVLATAWDTAQGIAGQFNQRRYNQLLRDDELCTELIVALVTQGFFNGYAQRLPCSH